MTRRTILALATFPLLLLAAACSDGGGGDLDAFCATAQRFGADNPAAAFARFDPNDPEGAAVLLRDAAGRLDEWADQAPHDVRDDVRALVDAATALATRFETDDDTSVDTEAVEAASAEVVDFTRDECGVELDV